MDGPRHERREHFRGKSRPGRVMSLRFRTAAHDYWIDAETRNIGVGGAFIAVQPQHPVGTRLILELRLTTSDRTFTLPAVVRWASAHAGGMGVQFTDVDVDILLELNDYFSSLSATGT